MNKKKIIKTIVIIVIVLLFILCIHIFRNVIIISKLQKQVSNYMESSNYHVSKKIFEEDKQKLVIEDYKKGSRRLVIIENSSEGKISKKSIYYNEKRIDTFTEENNQKIAELDNENNYHIDGIINVVETENLWQTIISSIGASVKKVKLNDKICYKISNFTSKDYMFGEDVADAYVEKETGLLLKSENDNTVEEFEYEFDNVDENIFIEPNISQYDLK